MAVDCLCTSKHMLPTGVPSSVTIPMHSFRLPSLASMHTLGRGGSPVGWALGNGQGLELGCSVVNAGWPVGVEVVEGTSLG